MDAILGISSDDPEKEVIQPKQVVSQEEKEDLNLKTQTVSLQDYFKKRMEEKLKKSKETENNDFTENNSSPVNPQKIEENSNQETENNSSPVKPKKRKREENSNQESRKKRKKN